MIEKEKRAHLDGRPAQTPWVSRPHPSPQNCTWKWGAVQQPGRCHKECVASALAQHPDVHGSVRPHLPLWPHCLAMPHLCRCPLVDTAGGE